MLGTANGAVDALTRPSLDYATGVCTPARRMRAAVGPLCIAAAAAAMPAGAAQWIAPIPLSAHGRAPSGTQVSCRALFGQEPEKRNAKGVLLFGYFLLHAQEKVTRAAK